MQQIYRRISMPKCDFNKVENPDCIDLVFTFQNFPSFSKFSNHIYQLVRFSSIDNNYIQNFYLLRKIQVA